MTNIEIINPFSGAHVERDITNLTQSDLDAYVQLIDASELYELEGVGDTPAAWLAAWVSLVGPEKAGVVIIGS